MNRSKSQVNFLHVLKKAKQQARRALLESADNDLIKGFVECAIIMFNEYHTVTKDGKNKLSNYSNSWSAFIEPKFSFNVDGNLNLKSRLIVTLLANISSGVIASVINNN